MGKDFSRGDIDFKRAHDYGFSDTSPPKSPAAEDKIHECAASGGGATVRCSGSGPKLTLFGVLLSLQHNLWYSTENRSWLNEHGGPNLFLAVKSKYPLIDINHFKETIQVERNHRYYQPSSCRIQSYSDEYGCTPLRALLP
jgi:hypothetical protein